MAGPLVALFAALRTAGPALARTASGTVASGSASSAANVAGLASQLGSTAGATKPRRARKTIDLESIELFKPPSREERSQAARTEASAALGALAGSAQQAVGSISPLGGKLLELAGKAKQAATFLATFGPGVLASRKELERYSGTIAQVFAMQERQQVVQDALRARATAQSVSNLGAAVYAFRENILPASVEFDKLTNNLARTATQIANVGAIAFQNSAAMGAVKATNAALDFNQKLAETLVRGMDGVFGKITGEQSTFFQSQFQKITGTVTDAGKANFVDFMGKLGTGDFGARSRRPGGNRRADRNDPDGEFPAW